MSRIADLEVPRIWRRAVESHLERPNPVAEAGKVGTTLSIPVVTGLCQMAEPALMVCASITIGVMLHRLSDMPPWGEFIVVSVIAIAVAGFISRHRRASGMVALLDPLASLPWLGLALAAGAISSAVTLALLHEHVLDLPYLTVQPAAWVLANGAVLLAFRTIVASRLLAQARAGRLSTKVALIGANAASMRFIGDAAGDPRLRVVGIYDDRMTRVTDHRAKSWLRGDIGDLIAEARRNPVDAIIIALPLEAAQRIADLRRRLAGIATDVFLATDSAAMPFAGGHFTTLGRGTVLAVSSRPLKDWPAFKKAAFDRIAGAFFLMLGLPLMAVIAVAVRLDSPGPVLFRQEREGLNGQPFTLLKFRSMFCHLDTDQSLQATAGDRRVTRVGYWLRRLSLDELPQLINVLRGDMSLVGPRPHLATTRAGNRLFHDVVPHYQARHRMKPGLTGWAQVQGLRGETRTEREILERVNQDLYYIENWSLALDLQIIWRTLLREVVSSSGKAY